MMMMTVWRLQTTTNICWALWLVEIVNSLHPDAVKIKPNTNTINQVGRRYW